VSTAVESHRTGAAIDSIRRTLAAGGVVAFATESSYGLGVDPRSTEGVEAIYRLKGRERGKPLPVVAADLEQLLALGVAPDSEALAWARPRWPAALSVLLPLGAPIAAAAGAAALAARIPARATLRELLSALGHALTATSANPSGEPAFTEPEPLRQWIESTGAAYILVDEGESPGGPPSTLVEIVDGSARLLREGRYRVD
jgi:L-threonylcarbamoyladenylate synthase